MDSEFYGEHIDDERFFKEHDGICRACQGINIESISNPGGYLHSSSYRDLEDRKDCILCSRLCGLLDPSGASRHSNTIKENTNSSISQHASADGVRLILHWQPNVCLMIIAPDVNRYVLCSLSTRKDDPATNYGVAARRVLSSTSSASSFFIAADWINDCVSHHNCSQVPSFLSCDPGSRQWPARLVEASPFQPDSWDVRLVDVSQEGPSSPYATLSYRWGTLSGQHEKYITTSDNLSMRMTRLPLGILPRTIRNALQIIRTFHIRYLWVDALCIIQDSHKDWQMESAKMGEIYARSFITIAADRSTSSDSGCYNELSASQARLLSSDVNFFKLRSKLSDGGESCLYFNTRFFSNEPSLLQGELDARAWTYQERILSPRILHYTSTQLFWECRQEYHAEDGEITWATEANKGTISGLAKNLFPKGQDLQPDMLLILDRWYCDLISSGYSGRALTKPSDILPAISALARAIQTELKSEYLAGLWRDHIHLGLAWERSVAYQLGHSESSFKRLDNSCPSWSWASYAAGVDFASFGNTVGSFSHVQSAMCLEDANVELESQDPFGQVLGGYLMISGRLRRALVRYGQYRQRGLVYLLDPKGTEIGQGMVDVVQHSDFFDCLLIAKHPILRDRSEPPRGIALLLRATGRTVDEYERRGLSGLIDLNFFNECPVRTITIV